MYCPTCHGHLDTSDRFCRHCGAKLELPTPVSKPAKTRRGRRRGPLTFEVRYLIGGEEFTPEEFRAGWERVVQAMVREALTVYHARHGTPALPRDTETETEC